MILNILKGEFCVYFIDLHNINLFHRKIFLGGSPSQTFVSATLLAPMSVYCEALTLR